VEWGRACYIESASGERTMAEPARKKMTVADFLNWDDGTDTRYELIGGEIVAMTPPVTRHSRLVTTIAGAIQNRLHSPCFAFSEVGIVLPWRNDAYYQADVAVSCEPESETRHFLEEPKTIIEILSRSTLDNDFTIKLPDYRAIPSVQEIALFSMNDVFVESWRRETGGWHVDDLKSGDKLDLRSIGVLLDLDKIYLGKTS
jgi:Uma2 family endonuclease